MDCGGWIVAGQAVEGIFSGVPARAEIMQNAQVAVAVAGVCRGPKNCIS